MRGEIALGMQNYRIVGHMGEGTFSEVLKCQSLLDGKLYACKKMKQRYESLAQVNNLREVQALRRLNPHSSIINLKEVVFDKNTGMLALICELMDMNIYELIKDRRSYLPESRVKLYVYQLCKSIYHMHRNGIFHRDVKPENILVKDNELKLADFGSCKSMYSKQPFTEYISTRWYRAPECLLTDGYYGHKMDMWSIGCVLFEIMSLRPLFPGSNELDQIHKIHDIVGTPSPAVLDKFRKVQSRSMEFNFPYKTPKGIGSLLKHASRQCVDLVTRLCTYDPERRLSAREALRHPFFKELRDAERKVKMKTRTPPSLQPDLAANKFLSSTLPPKRKHHHQHHQQQLHHSHNKGYSKHLRSKHSEDTHHHLVSLQPREYYMPAVAMAVPSLMPQPANKLNATLTLPQLPTKPHHHHSHYSSSLSTGLPSHSMRGQHGAYQTTFPPLVYSGNTSGKTSMYASGQHSQNPSSPSHHHVAAYTHIPSLQPKYSLNTRTRAL